MVNSTYHSEWYGNFSSWLKVFAICLALGLFKDTFKWVLSLRGFRIALNAGKAQRTANRNQIGSAPIGKTEF